MAENQGNAAPVVTFEACLDELEKVVRELEGGELSLDRSLQLFERGMSLSDTCRKQLEEAETRVEMLIRREGKMTAEPFRPGRTISGFRTGPLGMGHAVLTIERLDDVLPFYRDLLGFGLSDYILKPFRAFFFHVNPRHHSLAFIETGRNGVHHLMVELFSLDDVGQGYDIALMDKESIGVTLGRHTNDHVTSFYSRSPSDFMVEYGWGGRLVEPGKWTAEEYTIGPSLWGHDRRWLPEDKRAEARDMRLKNAADGVRYPVEVIAGNYRLMPGTCPWWDTAVGDRKAG